MSIFNLRNKFSDLEKIKKNDNFFLANEICVMMFGKKEKTEIEIGKPLPLNNNETNKFNDFKKDKQGLLNLFEKSKKTYNQFLKDLK